MPQMTLPLSAYAYERLDWLEVFGGGVLGVLPIVRLISFLYLIVHNTFLTLFLNNLAKDNTGEI